MKRFLKGALVALMLAGLGVVGVQAETAQQAAMLRTIGPYFWTYGLADLLESRYGGVVTTLRMAAMKTVAGLQMTGSASSTNFGLVYTPATGAYLIGTATSSGSTSNVAAYDFVLPVSYVAGTDITLKVACYYTNASSTASVHTMAAAAYLNTAAGAQGTTLIATAAQVCPITTAAYQTFVITGATLVPGSYLTLTFSAAVTNSGGASTEFLTAVTLL